MSIAPPERLTLADGRCLAYAQHGAADGWPLVVLHGLPGSRLQVPRDPAQEAASGVRLITLDRPGLGRSDHLPGRRFADFPGDLAQLLDHLGVGEFALMGISGGGPYAIACAIAMPERVRRLHLASPMGPLDAPDARRNMCLPIRTVFFTGRYTPPLLGAAIPPIHWYLRRINRPSDLFTRLFLPPADRHIFAGPTFQEALLPDLRESAAVSGRGILQEVRNLVSPWDIDPGAVRVPTTLWHGDADTVVPITIARHLAGLIPHCRATWYPAAGHFMIFRMLPAVLTLLQPE